MGTRNVRIFVVKIKSFNSNGYAFCMRPVQLGVFAAMPRRTRLLQQFANCVRCVKSLPVSATTYWVIVNRVMRVACAYFASKRMKKKGTKLGKMQQGNYIDHMGISRESLKALMVWRLCLPNLQARKSTDITQILRWLVGQARVKSLSQFESALSCRKSGWKYGNKYLQQYWNWHPRLAFIAKPKQMKIDNVILLLRAAQEAGLLKNEVGLGAMLLQLDMHEMLGGLANRWRSLKYPKPASEDDWKKVWQLAHIEANGLWQRRNGWHRKHVQLAIKARGAPKEEEAIEPKCIGDAPQNPWSKYVVGQKVVAVSAWVVESPPGC